MVSIRFSRKKILSTFILTFFQLYKVVDCEDTARHQVESNSCLKKLYNFTFSTAGRNEQAFQCPDDHWPHFRCRDGKSCFTMQQACDGFDDCADSTDECNSMCRQTYRCACEKQCIAMNRFCDGVVDCADGSDEIENSTQVKAGFFCSNKWNLILNHNKVDGNHWKERRVSSDICARELHSRVEELLPVPRTCRLPDSHVCDGVNHCGDHSDECSPLANCDESKKFYCANKRCIAQLNVCDGNDDCGDASDECQPDCKKNFDCDDGKCIAFAQFCDGVKDCPDGSDEITETDYSGKHKNSVLCSNINNLSPYFCILPTRYLCDGTEQCVNREDECTPGCSYSFRCSTGRCIIVNKVCDGFDDCEDMSDECNDSCHSNIFQCNNGSCLSVDRFCDGTNDCREGEDEDDDVREKGFYCSSIKRLPSGTKKVCRLPQKYVCDGLQQCENRTDECQSGCKHSFFCDNGTTCVQRSGLCNGIADCQDLTDESSLKGPICYQRGFKCRVFNSGESSKCVLQQNLVKDDIPDCVDKSDLCARDSNFTFQSNLCVKCLRDDIIISIKQICDGVFDCLDLSDECLCENNKVPEICQNLHFNNSENETSGIAPCLTKSYWNQTKKSKVLLKSNSLIEWIPIDKFCNGVKDCDNGVDEAYCQARMTRTFKDSTAVNYSTSSTVPGTMECFRFQASNPWTPRLARACDGNPECFSMEDECDMNCSSQPHFCRFRSFTGSFKCSENHILPGKIICDGSVDCDQTGDDERYCPNRFYCVEGGRIISIELNRVCDFSSDCSQGSDEMNCSNTHFYCKSKVPLYIRRYQVRDGIRDCSDGSDECSPDFFTDSIFSSEDFMIKQKFLQGLVWLMAFFAILGNAVVSVRTIYTFKHEVNKQKQFIKIEAAYNLLILNLAVADFLMGIFLLGLGVQNVKTKGSYCYHDRAWRTGSLCKALGVFSFLSSEVSIVTLAILATYRLYCVLQPIGCRYIKIRFILMSIGFSWFVGLIFALLPLSDFLQSYFISHAWIESNPYFIHDVVSKQSLLRFCRTLLTYKSRSLFNVSKFFDCSRWENLIESIDKVKLHKRINGLFGYYSAHSTCLPKFFVSEKDVSSRFSIGVTIFNFCVCIYISCVYVILFKKRSKLLTKLTSTNRKAVAFQKRIALLIGTNFICWVPICIIAFLRFTGFSISDDVYSFAAVILLPINSAVNPLFSNKLLDTRKFSCENFRRFKFFQIKKNQLGSNKAAAKNCSEQNISQSSSAQKQQKSVMYSKIETENSVLIASSETQV